MQFSILGAMEGPYSHHVEYYGVELLPTISDDGDIAMDKSVQRKEVRVHDHPFWNMQDRGNATVPRGAVSDASGNPSIMETSSVMYETDILTYLQKVQFLDDGTMTHL